MPYIRRILLCSLIIHTAYARISEINGCPYTISQPGQYHITTDLKCPGSGNIAISVMASNVQLHFDGHTLNGNNAWQFGVLVAGSNDNIVGSGTVTGFQFGIVVESLQDGTGETPPPTSGNQIVNVQVANSLSHGIVIINSVYNQLINCAANGNALDGILVGSDNSVISNTANGNGWYGIDIFSNDNRVIANETNGNTLAGIAVEFEASGNSMLGNKAADNNKTSGSFDLADFNSNCDSNIWRGNQFRTANQQCIH